MATIPDLSDVADTEWRVVAPLLPPQSPVDVQGRWIYAASASGLSYLVRSGAWRYFPRDAGSWSTVYRYFRLWRNAGWWELIRTRRGSWPDSMLATL